MMLPVDRHLLAQSAFEILTRDLEARGNVLSDMHRAALMELVDTFAAYASGGASGRCAFPLPTGMGKTSAVVAFIAAVDSLGYGVPVSVAASKVEALCAIKRDLIDHGVPPERIGLKHAVPAASEPSTGNEARLFQLVSHARVRSGRDFDLFGMYRGEPRALCLYDETLLRADSFAFSALHVRMALGALGPLVEDSPSQELAAFHAYLLECAGIIKGALDQLGATHDPLRQGLPVELPFRDEATLEAWRALLQRHRVNLKSNADILGQLLAVSQESLQVLTTEQGEGVISVRQAVPAALRDVVILDASGPIRELARMDPSITMVESFQQGDLKSFEDVEVFQLLASGGRHSIEQSFNTAMKEASAVSREVLGIMRRELKEDPTRAFLLFSFVARIGLDPQERLKADLQRGGIDIDAKTADGKPQFNFLTWGRQEGTNGYEHCESVILAGVLHRSHLEIAAAIKGQQAHIHAATPSDLVRHVLESEIAHAVYQAASRGSCRRMNMGKALRMRLHLIHSGRTLKTTLDRVMTGARWTYLDPVYLKKAAAAGKAEALKGHLLEFLRGLPEGTNKLSTRDLKVSLQVPRDASTSRAFTRVVQSLDRSAHGWSLQGRSLVRGAAAFGFSSSS